MAGFLRKKSKTDAAKANSTSNPQQNSSAPPLFARFATSNSTNDTPHSQKVVVSGPMSLSAVRKDNASVHSVRNPQHPVDVSRRRTGNAPPPSAFTYDPRGTELSNIHAQGGHQPQPPHQQLGAPQNSARYSLSAQQSLVPVTRDKPLPPSDPHRRASARAPQAVYADKPLPTAQPQQFHGPPFQPRSSVAGTNGTSYQPIMNQPQPSSASPYPGFDSQGRQSPLIDLPPEIALYQVSLVRSVSLSPHQASIVLLGG